MSLRSLGIVVVFVALMVPAHAEEDAPWSKGVSAADKDEAKARLAEGNDSFLAKDYRAALAKYEQAVAAWDHPAIRFNMVRALIQLDKNLEAFENLEKALAYGAAPLEETVYQEALNYKKVLENSIAVLEVACEQQSATVTVDGEPFVTCPGTKAARVNPGNHAVVAQKQGYLTSSQTVATFSGKQEHVDITLVALADATVMKRRWKAWKPWAVVGAGAMVGGLGGLLQLQSRGDFDRYDDAVSLQCPTGCPERDLLESTRNLASRARLENRIAISSMVTGGALAVTGLTLVILNRPRAVLPEQESDARESTTPQVVPSVSGDSVSLTVSGRF